MKRIYKNHDLQLDVTLFHFPINFELIDTINFKFYTNYPNQFIEKTEKDINQHNILVLPSQELDTLSEGVLFYDYKLSLIDSSMPDFTLDEVRNQMTEYYLCNDNDEVPPISDVKVSWGNIEGDINNQTDLKDYIDTNVNDNITNNITPNYYDKDTVDKKIADAVTGGTELDLTDYLKKIDAEKTYQHKGNYALKSDIPNISNLATKQEVAEKADKVHSHKEYLTEQQVDAKLSKLPSTDLSAYQKTVDADKKYQVKGNYALKSEIPLTEGLATKQEVAAKADKVHTHTEYATTKELDDKISKIPSTDLSAYQKTVDADKKYQVKGNYALKSEIPSIENLATKQELSNKSDKGHKHTEYLTASNISHLASKSDLDNYQVKGDYATVDDLANKANKQHTHSQYLTADDMVGYATKVELNDYQPKGNYALQSELVEKANKVHIHDQYMTQAEVDERINKKISTLPTPTGGTSVDLTEYLKKSEAATTYQKKGDYMTRAEITTELADKADKIHTHSQYLTSADIAPYATQEYVNQKVEDAITGSTTIDLKDYYKKSETYSKVQIDNKGFLTSHQDLSHLVPKTTLTSYYTKNDIDAKGYLTSHQSLAGYVPKSFLTSNYYDKNDIEAKGFLTQHQSLADYATKLYVNDEIDKKISEGAGINLTNYYKKSETYNRSEVDERIQNAIGDGFVKNDYYTKYQIDNKHFATEDFVNQKIDEKITSGGTIELSNYFTKAQCYENFQPKGDYALKSDLTPLATKEYVDKQISGYTGSTIDANKYYTKIQADEKFQVIGDYVTTSVLTSKLAKKADVQHTHDEYLTSAALNGYATKVELADYQPKGEYALKSDLTPLATQDYVNKKVENLPSDTYSKQEIDDKIDAVITAGTQVDLSGYYKKNETYSKKEIDDKHFLTSHQDISNLALKSEIPTLTSQLYNDSNFLTEHQSLKDYALKSEVEKKADASSVYTIVQIDNKNFATKSEVEAVDTQIRLDFYTKQQIDAKFDGINRLLDTINGEVI